MPSGRDLKVLLVAPTALDSRGRPIRQRRLYLPGLTLPMLAAATPSGVDLRLVCETVDAIPYDEPWDVVGITGMGSGVARGWQIAAEFRRRGCKVVQGGIGATLLGPAICLEHVDAVVLGEAENVWPRVLADVREGRLERVYAADQPPSIDALPPPRYAAVSRWPTGVWWPVQASRGCPHACRFCSVAAFSRGRYRKRPVEQVVRDVRTVRAAGSRYIAFIDDNIGVDWAWCRALWEAIVPERITWISQCSLQIADHPEMLELARRSGCRLLSIGIESTDPSNLASVQKSWNRPERYAEAIRTIRSHGIEVSTEMILGFDFDDASAFEKTYRFVMENQIPVPRVHILTPVPGTPLHDDLGRAGRILETDLAAYTGGKVVFRPARIEPGDLQAGYWRLYERLFTRRAILHRCLPNPARLPPFLRAFILGVNAHYRHHIRRRICPGIV